MMWKPARPWAPGAAAVAVAVVLITGCNRPDAAGEAFKASGDYDVSMCVTKRSATIAEIEQLLSMGEADAAWRRAVECVPSNDPSYISLRDRATIALEVKALRETRDMPAELRLASISKLQELDPAVAQEFVGETERLRQMAAEESIRARRAAIDANGGGTPAVGMSSAQALNSKWGAPQSINSTTTARGTREQWIYGDRRYLYVENGVVTGIQEQR